MNAAMTSSVGSGQTSTATPTATSSSPTATAHPRTLPSSGTLNMVKMPRTISRTPRKTARSLTDQSMSTMMPPATMLTMPLTSSTHQPLLTASMVSRAHERGPKGLVTSMISSSRTDEITMLEDDGRRIPRSRVSGWHLQRDVHVIT
jgi:hypothetical protein